ncbi:MAG TPA: DUF4870 domain-containing protein [bacterium]
MVDAASEPNQQARTWGLFCHLSALAGFLIPLGNILGPLIVWLVKRQELPFVNDQGKEALNFQITVTLAMLGCLALTLVVIGVLLLPVVGILALVLTVVAAVKANGGLAYRYPVNLRLIK